MSTVTETPNPATRRLLGDLLTRAELAAELDVTPRCLELWAVRRIGPPSIKIGRRIYYSIDEVRRWIASKSKVA